MMKAKSFFLAAFVLPALSLPAQTMREVWIDMPDSVVTYLTKSTRTELADYVDMKVEPATKNVLGDTVRIDTLTNDYISVSLSEASRLEMKLLEREGKEDIVCMLRTYYGPAAESVISFYGLDWHPLEGSFMPPADSIRCIEKPDSLTGEEFKKIKSMIEPELVQMRLSPENQSLTVCQSVPEMSEEDENLVKKILVQKKLNWNGENFN